MMIPSVGDRVFYILTHDDEDGITEQRKTGYRGTRARRGDVYPGIITRVRLPEDGRPLVNVRVFLDGTDDWWVFAVTYGRRPGSCFPAH